MSGTLYVVATPIGNLDDISKRALDILRKVDAIACENPPHHLKLLNHYGIKKRLLEYSPTNQANSAAGIVKLLQEGKDIALVSDAGTPLVSDPGQVLIRQAINEDIPVIPIPGASALTAIASVAYFPLEPMVFFGFLPKKEGRIKKEIAPFKNITCTLVFFVSSHRLKKSLMEINEIVGNAEVIIGREMTKANEEYIYGRISDILESEITTKGEFTVAVRNSKDK